MYPFICTELLPVRYDLTGMITLSSSRWLEGLADCKIYAGMLSSAGVPAIRTGDRVLLALMYGFLST